MNTRQHQQLDERLRQAQEETVFDIDLRKPYKSTDIRRGNKLDLRTVIERNQSIEYFFQGEFL